MSHKNTFNYRKRNRHGNKKKAANQNSTTKVNDAELSINKPLSPGKKRNTFVTCNNDKHSNTQYYGWKLYLENEEFKEGSNTVKQIEAMIYFLETHQDLSSSLTLANLEAGIAFNINFNDLYNDDIFINQWPNFKTDIQDTPRHTINCLKLAIHQSIMKTIPKDNLKNFMDSINILPTVRIKILNYQQTVSLQNLKVNSYGKLISTRGCVIRVGRIKHLAQWITFACSKCGLEKICKQPQGVYTLPRKCDNCGVSKFYSVLDSPCVRSIPFQMIRVQELINDDEENKGRMPRILNVELTDDLVNTSMPGDDITLTGIIKVQGLDDGAVKENTSNEFSLYMEAVTIFNNNNRCQNKSIMNSEMSLKDYFAIKEVYNKPDIFSLLVHSLCPGIYGHEIIKAGLLLSLFGGNPKHVKLRDDIHVLVVGDPGLGKSQMLQACARVATKGVYVCGNSSTSSGLTVTLTKENGTNDYALEPGALVLADRGCCCIDEFDKMSTQHQALLESMEQQSVSVAKSGVLCSLPARTSILAAANPIGGRYDRSKTIIQNLNMSEPLLSRFDLVFFLLDNPNKQLDRLLCKHVMKLHCGSNNESDKESIIDLEDSLNKQSKFTETYTLRERLLSFSGNLVDPIPQSVLRKYITYARQYVNPKLSAKAAEELQKYYLNLRSKEVGFGGLPIYNRQLEALIRLTEARAKSELRVEATEMDALEIIEIFQHTITNTLRNDITLSTSNHGKLNDKKVKAFINLLKNEVKLNPKQIFSTSQLNEIATNAGIIIQDFTNFISKLNEQGILIQIKRDQYRFVMI